MRPVAVPVLIAATAVASLGLAAPSHAADASPPTKKEMVAIVSDPSVLPTGFGAVTLNVPIVDASVPQWGPTLCWKPDGTPITVTPGPATTVVRGYVTSDLGNMGNLATAIYQYESVADARKEWNRYRNTECDAFAMLTPDEGAKPVPVQQANDIVPRRYGTPLWIGSYNVKENGKRFSSTIGIRRVGDALIAVSAYVPARRFADADNWVQNAVDAAVRLYRAKARS
jgi:hypothetical protein